MYEPRKEKTKSRLIDIAAKSLSNSCLVFVVFLFAHRYISHFLRGGNHNNTHDKCFIHFSAQTSEPRPLLKSRHETLPANILGNIIMNLLCEWNLWLHREYLERNTGHLLSVASRENFPPTNYSENNSFTSWICPTRYLNLFKALLKVITLLWHVCHILCTFIFYEMPAPVCLLMFFCKIV